jgi:hypothetical protein
MCEQRVRHDFFSHNLSLENGISEGIELTYEKIWAWQNGIINQIGNGNIKGIPSRL